MERKRFLLKVMPIVLSGELTDVMFSEIYFNRTLKRILCLVFESKFYIHRV